MADEKLKALRECAEKATPKEWGMPDDGRASVSAGFVLDGWDGLVATVDAGDYARSKAEGLANATFIAAANPKTVLALLDEIDRLKGIVCEHGSFALECQEAARKIADEKEEK